MPHLVLCRIRLCLYALGSVLLLAACQNNPPVTTPPPAWSVVDTIVNSASPGVQPGNGRQIVFFSKTPWQSTSRGAPYFASGWRNDVLVSNPYSFQLRVEGGNFLNGGLILRDVTTGQELSATPARVNHSENCGPSGHRPIGGTTTQADSTMLCYYDPGEVPTDPNATGFIPRPALPQNKAAYSVELVSSCQGRLMYLDMRCPTQASVATVLTISPPVLPSAPVHGQKFRYELISRNAAGTSVTAFTAVYVEPNRCQATNILITPGTADAGARVDAQWFVQHCHSAQVLTDDPAVPVLYSATTAIADQASENDFNATRPYVLPKRLKVEMTLEARDALGRLASKQATVAVSPCSISLTHASCPTRCQAMPPPANCPQPPAPVCPVGEGDANRQNKQFNFEVLCSTGGGTATKWPETEWACTEAAAKQAVNNRVPLGCGVVVVTGPWAESCPNGAAKIDWEFCLACASSSSTVFAPEERKACYLNDAVDLAKQNRPGQNCWLNNQGKCP